MTKNIPRTKTLQVSLRRDLHSFLLKIPCSSLWTGGGVRNSKKSSKMIFTRSYQRFSLEKKITLFLCWKLISRIHRTRSDSSVWNHNTIFRKKTLESSMYLTLPTHIHTLTWLTTKMNFFGWRLKIKVIQMNHTQNLLRTHEIKI